MIDKYINSPTLSPLSAPMQVHQKGACCNPCSGKVTWGQAGRNYFHLLVSPCKPWSHLWVILDICHLTLLFVQERKMEGRLTKGDEIWWAPLLSIPAPSSASPSWFLPTPAQEFPCPSTAALPGTGGWYLQCWSTRMANCDCGWWPCCTCWRSENEYVVQRVLDPGTSIWILVCFAGRP